MPTSLIMVLYRKAAKIGGIRPLPKNFSKKNRKVIDKSPRRVYNVGIITKEA